MAKPLKRELSAIVAALLEPADTPEEVAERVIEALDAARVDRKLYVFGTRVGGMVSLFGPYPTVHQAQKGLEGCMQGPLDVSEHRGIWGLISPATLAAATTNPLRCPECDHPWAAHAWPRLGGVGCVVALPGQRYIEGARRSGELQTCPCGRSKR